ASLARAAGKGRGINFCVSEVVLKRRGLVRDLVPGAVRLGVLISPANAATAEATLREVKKAADALGLQIHVVNASTSSEINAAFAIISRERAEALFVAPDAFFNSRRVQLVTLATRDRIGRYGVLPKATVIGSTATISYPQQPSGSPWRKDECGQEALVDRSEDGLRLGYRIDGGPEEPSSAREAQPLRL